MQKATIDTTGNSVVEYVVKSGDSYSSIAAKFALDEWQAIARYNTQVRPILKSQDPAKLTAGKRIFIPRNQVGYQKLVKSLLLLRDDLDTMGLQEKWRLEALDNEQKANDVIYDTIANCATMLGTFFVKAAAGAVQGGKAAVANAKAVEDAAINAHWHKYTAISDYVDDVDSIFETLHTTLRSASAGAKKSVRSFIGEEIWDKGSEIVLARTDLALLRKFDSALFKKEFVGFKSYAASAFDCTWAALEYLDYLKPSTLSRMWVTGVYFSLPKNLPNEAEIQAKAISKAVEAGTARIDKKIKDVKAEAKVVWGIDIKS